MKLRTIYQAAVMLCLTVASQLFPSCSQPESDLVAFVEDNQLRTPNDTVYSLIGIVGKMQVIADRTVLLGELRGELTSLTDHAKLDLKAIADFTAGADNPYNNARDYYAVIQNCNYFLAHADTALMKRGYKVFEKEYAVIKAYRAWTYLQLALNYRRVPFFDQPILAYKNAVPENYPFYDVKEMAEYFITDLAPYVDTDYPSYGTIGSYNSSFFYIPVRVLLGDFCLWAGRYRQAARYYHDYLTTRNDTHPTGTSSVGWTDYHFDHIADSYSSAFSNITRNEFLAVIPMEQSEYDGIESHLHDVFSSTDDNNYYYQATHSPAYDQISRAQRYVLVYQDPVTLLPDTVSPADTVTYASETMRGDLRLYSNYRLRANLSSGSTAYSTLTQTCYKQYTTTCVYLYRLQHVYLRFAEALNRAGYPESAFAVLKYGLCYENVNKYIGQRERTEASDLLNFSQYSFDRSNTQGIHSRGSGNAAADTTYVIPQLSTRADSILFVEDKICDEMALETAAEGVRFYDLMRLATHRDDPTYLADRVARRNGAANYDYDLYRKLSDKRNWYLPLE